MGLKPDAKQAFVFFKQTGVALDPAEFENSERAIHANSTT